VRILYVLENYFPHVGGVENGFRSLCEGMAARGHEVTVLTRSLPGAPSAQELAGVRIVRVPSGDSRYFFTFTALGRVVALAGEHDVVHTTTYNAAPPAWLGARLRRKPVLITVNETWMGHWRSYSNFGPLKAAVHEALERAVFTLPYDRYVSISAATQRSLIGAMPSARARSEIVYYAFDAAPWQAGPDPAGLRAEYGFGDRYLVLGYGRPGTSKGFEHLVDAYPAMRAAIPNAALVLILSRASQYRREWEALQRRADPSVIFMDSRPWPEITRWVRAADCVVVPSLTEGFGYTTLEAAAAGRPIVASDTTSIPEVIYGRYVLVRPRDSAAIAAGVATIAAGGGERREARGFPLHETIANYERIYRSLAEGRGR
jgi:glycosyltransferase involved in cell wall biosynthesis